MPTENELERARSDLERERKRVAELERFVEEKCHALYLAQQHLDENHEFLDILMSALPNAVILLDIEGRIVDANPHTNRLSGYARSDLIGRALDDLVRFSEGEGLPIVGRAIEAALVARDGEAIPVLFHTTRLARERSVVGLVCIATDLRDQQILESKLRESKRLESVGQLAAGVAHELNTPIQFVSDSVQFLSDAFEDLERVRFTIEREILEALDVTRFAKQMAHIEAIRSEVDFDFLLEEIPEAVRRCRVGTERVSAIVRAMKRFAHPGNDRMALEDVNEVLDSSAVMARSEYKYCADMEMDLGTIPLIPLDVGQLNQAIVNLIVNAAHAIQDSGEEGSAAGFGRIRITSEVDGDSVLIRVQDDGIGMSAKVRERIFDPFFTTKCIGRGTGQGLAQVWGAVVERHQGSIEIESEPGRGTRFEIRLPIVTGDTA